MLKKCKLANKKNGFANVGAKLKVSAFFSAPSPIRGPLSVTNPNNHNSKRKIMNELFLHNFKSIANNYIDKMIVGNNSRKNVIDFFNIIFEEAFNLGEIDRLCKLSSTNGNKLFKTSLSSFSFRSGLELKILNDFNLQTNDVYFLVSIVLGNPYFVRKLISLGYDTLKITTSSNNLNLLLELQSFTTLNNKLLK